MLIKIGKKYFERGCKELTTKVNYNGVEVTLAEYNLFKERESNTSYYYIKDTGTAYHSDPDCHYIDDNEDVVYGLLADTTQELHPCSTCVN